MCIYNALQIPSTKFWLVGRKIGRRWWWLHSVWLSRYHKIIIYWDLITVTTMFMYWTSVKLKNVRGLFIVVQFYPWFKSYFCKGPLYSFNYIGSLNKKPQWWQQWSCYLKLAFALFQTALRLFYMYLVQFVPMLANFSDEVEF